MFLISSSSLSEISPSKLRLQEGMRQAHSVTALKTVACFKSAHQLLNFVKHEALLKNKRILKPSIFLTIDSSISIDLYVDTRFSSNTS